MIHESPVIVALFGLGAPEMIGLLFLVVLLFGAKRLPELARGIGQSLKEFKKASNTDEAPAESTHDESVTPAKNGASKPAIKSASVDHK